MRPPPVVLCNPLSRRNRLKGQIWTDDCGYIVHRTSDISQLPEIIASLPEKTPPFLVLDGGDGFVIAGISAMLDRIPPFPLVLVPSGSTNLVARRLGILCPRHVAPQRLLAAENIPVRRARPFRLLHQDNGTHVHGFFLGAGDFHRLTSSFQDFLKRDIPDIIAFPGILATLVRRLPAPFSCEISVQADDVSLDGEPRGLFLASTLDRLLFSFSPFARHEPGKISFMETGAGSLWRVLARLARHVLLAPQAGNATCLDIRLATPAMLDGETIPPGRIRLTPGPELSFLRL